MERLEECLPDEAGNTNNPCVGVPPFRAETYWHHLDAMDLTDSQKDCMLRTLWAIMTGFVDLGFGVDPVQQILPAMMHGALEAEFEDAANNNKSNQEDAE